MVGAVRTGTVRRGSVRRRVRSLILVACLVVGSGAVVAPAAGAVPKPGSTLTLETSSLLGYTDRVDLDPVGPSIGDIVTFRAPVTRRGSAKDVGLMTGSLRNVGIDVPRAGSVMREVNLVFVLDGGRDELVVGGAAEYPATAPTLAQRTRTVRPLIGGSGRYAGARGDVVTVHRADDTWSHTFRFSD